MRLTKKQRSHPIVQSRQRKQQEQTQIQQQRSQDSQANTHNNHLQDENTKRLSRCNRGRRNIEDGNADLTQMKSSRDGKMQTQAQARYKGAPKPVSSSQK